MSKSKEIAEQLNAEITRTVHLDVMHHEAAAHILAQDAEIEQLKADLKAEFDGSAALRQQHGAKDTETVFAFVARVAAERDQARDALRVCVVAMESVVGNLEDDGSWPKHRAAIKQAKEALK